MGECGKLHHAKFTMTAITSNSFILLNLFAVCSPMYCVNVGFFFVCYYPVSLNEFYGQTPDSQSIYYIIK